MELYMHQKAKAAWQSKNGYYKFQGDSKGLKNKKLSAMSSFFFFFPWSLKKNKAQNEH